MSRLESPPQQHTVEPTNQLLKVAPYVSHDHPQLKATTVSCVLPMAADRTIEKGLVEKTKHWKKVNASNLFVFFSASVGIF